MTLVTINAVVDVSRNIVVMEVRGIISAVASRALEYGVVVGVGVAR